MKARVTITAVLMAAYLFANTAGADQSDLSGPNGRAANSGSRPATNGQPQMADIHDIKPLRAPGISPWLLYGLPAVMLVGALAALFAHFRRRQSARAAEAIVPDPPDVIAMRSLDELERRADLDGRRFYFRLSAIVRGYIEQRFNLDALEMTTEELLPAIGRLHLETGIQQQLKQLLLCAEPIKFAGQPATKEKMQNDLSFGRQFITMTRSYGEEVNV